MIQERVKSAAKKREERPFTRFCPICKELYARSKIYAPGALKEGYCEDCRKQLKDGCTALVALGGRYLLWKKPSPAMAKHLQAEADNPANDLTDDDRALVQKVVTLEAGTVVNLAEDEMDAVLMLAGKGKK